MARQITASLKRRPRVLLADDHTMLLEAFRHLLEPQYEIVGTASDGRAMLELAGTVNPDVVVLDISMPQLNGMQACVQLREKLPGVKIVFLTVNENPAVAAESIRMGASGFLLKSSAAAELISAIKIALADGIYITPLITKGRPANVFLRDSVKPTADKLTARQREVLQLLAEGRSMKEAGAILNLTARTIAYHKYTIMEALALKTGAELVQYAVEHRIVPPRG